MRLVSLNRARDRTLVRERDDVAARLRADSRAMGDGIDGYAIVTFRHLPDGDVKTSSAYHARKAVDVFALPHMFSEKISARIMRGTEPDDAA